jgi:hypothetical protein
LGILIIALCVWTARCPIGGRKIDPPEVSIVSAKLDAYLMEATGSELDVCSVKTLRSAEGFLALLTLPIERGLLNFFLALKC